MKKIAILGITGSIGTSAVNIVRNHSEDFTIVLASSHNNYLTLSNLAAEFKIPYIVLTNGENKKPQTDFQNNTKLYRGSEALQQLLNDLDIDIVLNAISGSAGLISSLTTVKKGIDLALANKESLVLAGHLIETELSQSGSKILPVDSEHSAIYQAIGSTSFDEVRSLTLTASGGPFRDLLLEKFPQITLEDTLKHPTWDMGNKVTIDSATMMNKGLEVIEAHWLFKRSFNEIDALIHPQSIIHSFVKFVDGSLIAQLSFPDMQLPILYALAYPKRLDSRISETDLAQLPTLTFGQIEQDRYPLYYLARQIGKEGGLLPTIMNAANEAAIDLFLDRRIGFIDIHKLIAGVTAKATNISTPDLMTIISTNSEVFQKVKKDYKNILSSF
jgi:1-deoxy-D-xylulose-5-phosphate reductoisomerase